MILTIHQPAYLPWLGLIHKIAISDTYVYLDIVQFEKNGNTNRNKIKMSNGPSWLTVPVFLGGHTKNTIKDIEIDNTQNWQNKHWNSLYTNYNKAPFFYKYSDFLENTYKQKWRYIAELDEYMLKWILQELNITTAFYKASDLNFEGHKSDLIFDICEKTNADVYISGMFGKDYLDKEKFTKKNIKIYFQDYKHPVYPQLYRDFLPYMSLLDLMFNCGDDSLNMLMKGNVTKNDIEKLYSV